MAIWQMYDKFDMHIQLAMCSPIASAKQFPKTHIRSIRSSLCSMDGSSIGGFRNAGEWPDENGERFERKPAGIFKNSQVRRT
jgi:hypothetical protein